MKEFIKNKVSIQFNLFFSFRYIYTIFFGWIIYKFQFVELSVFSSTFGTVLGAPTIAYLTAFLIPVPMIEYY